MEKFTGDIVAALQKHKKACGISNMRQNYKGTGSRSHRRQIWITFKSETKRSIDIWLEDNQVSFFGVCRQGPERVNYEQKSAEQIALEVAQVLQTL